jgi:hypothetical protein
MNSATSLSPRSATIPASKHNSVTRWRRRTSAGGAKVPRDDAAAFTESIFRLCFRWIVFFVEKQRCRERRRSWWLWWRW